MMKGQVILSNMSGQVLQSKQGSGKEEIRFSGILLERGLFGDAKN